MKKILLSLLLFLFSISLFSESLFLDRDGFRENGASKGFNNFYELNLNYEMTNKILDTHIGGEFLFFSYYFYYERDFEESNNKFIYSNALSIGDYFSIGGTYQKNGLNLNLGEAYFSFILRNSFLYFGGVLHANRVKKQSLQFGALFYNQKISPYFHLDRYKNSYGFSTGVSFINISGFNLSYDFSKHEKNISHSISLGVEFPYLFLGNKLGFSDNKVTNKISLQLHTKRKRNSLFNKDSNFLYFKLDSKLSEIGDGGLLTGENYSFLNLLVAIKKGIDDENIKGFIFNMDSPTLSVSQAEEIVNLLIKGKKPYYTYIKRNSLGDYILASNSKKIAIHPATTLDITGPSFVTLFYKTFLEKLGIKASFFKRAEYKSAPEKYIRNTPSKESEIQLNQLIINIKKYVVEILSNRRKFLVLEELLNNAPYSAKAAKSNNLVDEITYLDQFLKEIIISNNKNNTVSIVTPENYFNRYLKNLIYNSDSRVAVLSIDGVITKKNNFELFKDSNYEEVILKSIEEIKNDSSIKHVIVRVNSPGGDGLVSDEIYHALNILKENKKVYVSMGSVAASGGYYVSLSSDKIYANKLTITGSIGVYSGKFVFKKLLNNIFINIFIKTFWKNGDLFSSYKELNNNQNKKMEELVEAFYQLFLDRVQKSRKLSFKKVNEIAKGRVYTGIDALNNKLVDKIGGFYNVLDDIQNRYNIQNFEIVAYPQNNNILKMIFSPEKKLIYIASLIMNLLDSKVLLLPDFLIKGM